MEKKIKIAFTISQYIGGGAEHVTDIIALGLEATGGYEATIMTYTTDSVCSANAISRGIRIEQLPEDLPFYSEAMTEAVGQRLREGGFDVVVMAVEPLKSPERLKSLAPGCKVLFHLHGMPLFDIKAKMDWKAKRSSMISMAFRRLREQLFHKYRRQFLAEYRKIYDAVDGYVVLCDGYSREVEAIVGAKGASSRVVAMYNPVALNPGVPSGDGNQAGHGKTVLFVGRLNYSDKRPDRLLRIWARVAPLYPDWRLKIVGDGPYREEMERMVQELGIAGSVEFCGYTTDPAPYYAEASVLCLTSEFEGWPGVVAEAQAAGVWPISFDISAGVRELVGTDGTRGTLVKPYSEREYARKLAAVMSDPDRIAALRPAMLESTRRYAPEAVVAEWDRYLRRLCGK